MGLRHLRWIGWVLMWPVASVALYFVVDRLSGGGPPGVVGWVVGGLVALVLPPLAVVLLGRTIGAVVDQVH